MENKKRKKWPWILLGVFGGVALLVGLFFVKAMQPMAPNNYTEIVKTGGDIEAKYLKNGTYDVSYVEEAVDEDYKKFEIYYPTELKEENKKYPVLVFINGTGVKASKYPAQFKHFASWGFIAIGTEEEESWDAVAAEASLDYLIAKNNDTESIFYNKVDLSNVGAIGHSQGGAGVFNAITERSNSNLYKTAVSLSPTHEEIATSLKWHYDLTKINVPIMILAGMKGDFEMKSVIPIEALNEMYEKIDAPKAMARKLDMEHGDMLYSADGYVTAWFMWKLRNDEEASKAFVGDNAELLSNKLYTNQKIDLNK